MDLIVLLMFILNAFRENLGHIPDFKVVTVRGLGYKVEVENNG